MAESFKKLSENDQKDVETETQSEGNTTKPNFKNYVSGCLEQNM